MIDGTYIPPMAFVEVGKIPMLGTRRTPQYTRPNRKIQNNEPCYCKSGVKYKKCCKLKA